MKKIEAHLLQRIFLFEYVHIIILGFYGVNSRIDMKKFSSFNNWNHVFYLSFSCCGWFNDDDWNLLVSHADNFNNLKKLILCKNV